MMNDQETALSPMLMDCTQQLAQFAISTGKSKGIQKASQQQPLVGKK
jgi:hypothetical protein